MNKTLQNSSSPHPHGCILTNYTLPSKPVYLQLNLELTDSRPRIFKVRLLWERVDRAAAGLLQYVTGRIHSLFEEDLPNIYQEMKVQTILTTYGDEKENNLCSLSQLKFTRH